MSTKLLNEEDRENLKILKDQEEIVLALYKIMAAIEGKLKRAVLSYDLRDGEYGLSLAKSKYDGAKEAINILQESISGRTQL